MRVVDASAIAAFLFDEAEAAQVAALIQDQTLAAPILLGFELANVCLVKSRRQSAQREALMAAHGLRHRLAIREYPVDHAEVLALAEAARLTPPRRRLPVAGAPAGRAAHHARQGARGCNPHAASSFSVIPSHSVSSRSTSLAMAARRAVARAIRSLLPRS